ncbi:MAG: hypothetical protein OQL08_02380 [Gammaproteobacteria bacterium]|nr:hypothetical protein [Gammaproteobacteria bacterium]
MVSKTRLLLLLIVAAVPLGCSHMTMQENHGKSVSKNTLMQTVNLSASQESHPDVKMDGQKAADVVRNYRKESPKADTADLTK